MDVFAYFLEGPLRRSMLSLSDKDRVLIWSHLSLSGIYYCPRELFLSESDSPFFLPPFVFYSDWGRLRTRRALEDPASLAAAASPSPPLRRRYAAVASLLLRRRF